MLIALAGERPFVTPRTKFEIDIDAVLAKVEGDVATKGMFFSRALSLVNDADAEDEVLLATGLADERFVPFKDYPWADFFRLCCHIGDHIHGHRSAGLRLIGRTLYSEFADSLPGKLLFGLLRNNADRVISLGAKAWNMSGTPGEIISESIGDCHYRYHFVDYPVELCETMSVGILEGALAECGEAPRILYGEADPKNAVLDIRWGDAPVYGGEPSV